jgi:hypothetical protein
MSRFEKTATTPWRRGTNVWREATSPAGGPKWCIGRIRQSFRFVVGAERDGECLRVCYDRAQSFMIINLKGTYYPYCELPNATFDALMGAPSMGQFYNQKIKARVQIERMTVEHTGFDVFII